MWGICTHCHSGWALPELTEWEVNETCKIWRLGAFWPLGGVLSPLAVIDRQGGGGKGLGSAAQGLWTNYHVQPVREANTCTHSDIHARTQIGQSNACLYPRTDGSVHAHQAQISQSLYLVCRLLMRHSMSKWPAEYCSITSFTSYGRSVSLNFFLATWNFIILQEKQRHL